MKNVWFIIFYCLLTITKEAQKKTKNKKQKKTTTKQL